MKGEPGTSWSLTVLFLQDEDEDLHLSSLCALPTAYIWVESLEFLEVVQHIGRAQLSFTDFSYGKESTMPGIVVKGEGSKF